MSIRIDYDPGFGILRAQISDQFDVKEYRDVIMQITNGKDYPPTTPAIWDLRTLDFSDLELNLAYVVKEIRSTYNIRNRSKIAYVVSGQLAYGLMRMLQAITDSEDMSLVSYDYDEAETWLLSDAETPRADEK